MNLKILQTILLASSLVYLQGCFWHSRTVVERERNVPATQTTVHHQTPSGSSVDVTTRR